MKHYFVNPLKKSWLKAIIIQILACLAAGLLVSLAVGLPPLLSGLAWWLFMPLAGALSAFQAVRRGLLNYAAWIAPPACLYAAHFLLWRYAPPAGPVLFCAFIALVGAAAGEVYMQRKG